MAFQLQGTRGYISIVGAGIDQMAHSAILAAPESLQSTIFDAKGPFHITVITKKELRSLSSENVAKLELNADTSHLFSCGIGGNSGVYFVVIIWAAGQNFRRSVGLAPKQFHITLTSRDNHDMDKGVASLLPGQNPHDSTIDYLDHLSFTNHIFHDYLAAHSSSLDLIRDFPDSHRGFLRLGDAALRLNWYKLAMLAYACGFERVEDEKVKGYCIKRLIECSKWTEWGSVLGESETTQIPKDLSSHLLHPWSEELRNRLSDLELTPSLCLESRHPLFIPSSRSEPGNLSFFKLPRFFRWLIPFHIAIMSTPKNADDIAALASSVLGIRHVLTLTEEEPLPRTWFHGKPISNTFLPVRNYHPPSIEQMDIIMRLVENSDNLPLLVHCGGGKGRAGTVAACYLAAYGFSKPKPQQTQPEMSSGGAITALRSLRPGSIETTRQEQFVQHWCSTIWKRQSIYPELASEPAPCLPEIKGVLKSTARLFILCGLPGSGKSWFSEALLARDPRGWTRVSQDESGSRAFCETEIGHEPKGRMLLDRCNVTSEERRGWISLASSWATSVICIWFDYSPELCTARAQMRTGHPTLPPGSRVRNAVEQMRRMFKPPQLNEGFAAIVTIRSFEAARELAEKLTPVSLYKFPRTPHLINLGAATSDDVVLPATTNIQLAGRVVVTEKVDGANMGFSLSSDRSRIVVQNRSHYVNSSTHEQFKKLGLWVDNHRDDLYKVLDRDPVFPERYILFGEWLYATHSIPYTQLPDRFIAFDLYDRTTSSFVDTASLSALLQPTSIELVPAIYEGDHLPSETGLKNFVQTQSRFWDGKVEGIYLKVERGGQVVSRGKVVRADFISGNEHWTKGALRVNGLASDESIA